MYGYVSVQVRWDRDELQVNTPIVSFLSGLVGSTWVCLTVNNSCSDRWSVIPPAGLSLLYLLTDTTTGEVECTTNHLSRSNTSSSAKKRWKADKKRMAGYKIGNTRLTSEKRFTSNRIKRNLLKQMDTGHGKLIKRGARLNNNSFMWFIRRQEIYE